MSRIDDDVPGAGCGACRAKVWGAWPPVSRPLLRHPLQSSHPLPPHLASARRSYTTRPWLKSLQDVVPELQGAKTEDRFGNGNAVPVFPDTAEDVNAPGVSALSGVELSCCA